MMFTLFSVFQPSPGLAFWAAVIFLIFWPLISKYAWKPMINALETRQNDIQQALDTAKLAREEMSNLKSENQKLLEAAHVERSKMLEEATQMKNQIIADAKEKAKQEASKISANARLEIDNQTRAALADAKNKVGLMAVEIAEKVIKKELKGNPEQESFVAGLVKDLNLN